MNILLYLYFETFIKKSPEKIELLNRLIKLTNIAKRRNKVIEIVNEEKKINVVKEMKKNDKKSA